MSTYRNTTLVISCRILHKKTNYSLQVQLLLLFRLSQLMQHSVFTFKIKADIGTLAAAFLKFIRFRLTSKEVLELLHHTV